MTARETPKEEIADLDSLGPPPAVQAPIELVTQADERKSARRRLNVLVALLFACVVVIIGTFAITVATYRTEVAEANARADTSEARADKADDQLANLISRRTNFEEVIAASERANFCTINVRARYDIAVANLFLAALAQPEGEPLPEEVRIELEAATADYVNLNILCPPPPEPDANVEGIPVPETDDDD